MANLLYFFADYLPEQLALEKSIKIKLQERVNQAVLITTWELQSKLATPVVWGLVAFTELWIAALATLLWSWTTTLIFDRFRKVGYPDLFVHEPSGKHKFEGRFKFLGKLFFAGIVETVYTKVVSWFYSKPRTGFFGKVFGLGLRGCGLTCLGVTANHHVFSQFGMKGRALLGTLLFGQCLHVPYMLAFGITANTLFLSVYHLVL